MPGISTHVLDTSRGRPAAGIRVLLAFHADDGWVERGRAETDADGRCRSLLVGPLEPGTWRLAFDTRALSDFFPEVVLTFRVPDASQHYHVPLLISPYGFSTYRGS
jgi:5-hydroxyisourate hydrolase